MPSSLFPVPPSHIVAGFTTSPLITLHNVVHVALADAALGVHKVSGQTTHRVVTVPGARSDEQRDKNEDTQAWEACFPAGSINPGNKHAPAGGFGFYLRGPPAFHDMLKRTDADGTEVLMSYEVLFEAGWDWRKGGKLPGIYGGVGDSAYGCTGGRQTDRCACFNLRLMWRDDGLGELYAYLPQHPANTAGLLAVPPRSIQHPDFGFSAGRGAWRFETGRWTAVAQRVRMNRVGHADGEVEVFIDGRSVIHATGLVLRDAEKASQSQVQGLHMQSFFGGHESEWASPKNQRAWFTSISGAVLKRPAGRAQDEL